MEEIVGQINTLIDMIMALLMLGAFVAVLKIIFWDIFPPYFKHGAKLTFRGAISPFLAFAMMLIAIQNAPALLAGSISQGYAKAMPEFNQLGGMVLGQLTDSGYTPQSQINAMPVYSSPQPSSKQGTYIVKAGDTLAIIANKHGVSPKMIADENAIVNGIIEIGQVLYIPESCTYIDASGITQQCPPLP